METRGIEVERTLKDRKFLGLLVIVLLITYALPFPLISGFLEDYEKTREILKQMEQENDAITCHQVYSVNPEFFGSHGMDCDNTYYRPNETTVSCCGMSVYRDTYWEYIRAKDSLRRELPRFIAFVIWVIMSILAFSYALVDAAVKSQEESFSLKESVLSGFRALPALIASEFIVFLALLLVLIVLAIPLAIFGTIGGILVGILAAPAFALVVPIYYFERKIGPVHEIWKVIRNNTGGYIVLGLLLTLFDTITTLQYGHYLGIGTLLIMIAVGAPRYILNSVGALVVYLGTGEATGSETKEGQRIESEA
ncbi:hypothetical protein A3L11_06385 [Thermococcus siculi]|uniref:Uncharacterized protein n=1 Tax=Thermococcus siculi TaxID=72803 RepID=A0A2Z2MY19_9EURY|nr:hypothetical protein [Thermococcus siculi]ASJ08870.1 hypothetical protein A3L11_06385 [Thermococcus siculi]